ncbi:MAG: hypothetical protein ABSG62_09955 [Terracidiphilus sp.]|jgi:hypothetical protein
MANNLLMLIKLDTDTIARLSLIISIVAVIVSLVSAIAAIFAAFYSKRATTKGNLARVEQNTRRLEQVSNTVSTIDTRMHQQEEQEALQAQAQRVSISVEGEAVGEVPLELLVTLQDSSVRVSRVERLTEAGSALGSSSCKSTDNALVFKSILAQEKVRQWWDAGESTSDGGARSVLRVYLLLDESGREVYRDVPVSIVEGLRNVGIADLVVWTIKGSI